MKYPAHTSMQFDSELMTVCNDVLRMSAIVENQFRTALSTVMTIDAAAIQQVLNEGQRVNAMEIEIDERCAHILVQRQPTANDLRLVSAIIKTINDLERIGDESENIARQSQILSTKCHTNLPCCHQIKYMAEVAVGMLGAAIQAFDALDSEAARKVGRKDTLIDDEFRSVLRHLVAYMMEDSNELTTTLQIAFIARAIERVGEHAKNISEYVIYMIEGRESRNFSTI